MEAAHLALGQAQCLDKLQAKEQFWKQKKIISQKLIIQFCFETVAQLTWTRSKKRENEVQVLVLDFAFRLNHYHFAFFYDRSKMYSTVIPVFQWISYIYISCWNESEKMGVKVISSSHNSLIINVHKKNRYPPLLMV